MRALIRSRCCLWPWKTVTRILSPHPEVLPVPCLHTHPISPQPGMTGVCHILLMLLLQLGQLVPGSCGLTAWGPSFYLPCALAQKTLLCLGVVQGWRTHLFLMVICDHLLFSLHRYLPDVLHGSLCVCVLLFLLQRGTRWEAQLWMVPGATPLRHQNSTWWLPRLGKLLQCWNVLLRSSSHSGFKSLKPFASFLLCPLGFSFALQRGWVRVS